MSFGSFIYVGSKHRISDVAIFEGCNGRVYFVTALAFILPLIVYEEIELMVLRFILVCITSVASTLMFGYYLGFGEADRVKIKTKIVSIIKNKFHKK